MDDRQYEADAARPSLLLVGTPHLANRNRDLFNVQYDDMLAPSRQREIAQVVERLRRYAPTKVAVEVDTERDAALNAEYRRYRAGDFALPADEVYQLGFRTAAALDHARIYAVNWNRAESYSRGMDEVLAYAQAHQPELARELLDGGARAQAAGQAAAASSSVLDLLREANDPTNLRRSHRVYLTVAQIGAGSDYVGIGWMQGWYARNLRIFVNLTRIAAAPEDRLLVVYGAGHIPLLAQLACGSRNFTLEPVAPYLDEVAPASPSVSMT